MSEIYNRPLFDVVKTLAIARGGPTLVVLSEVFFHVYQVTPMPTHQTENDMTSDHQTAINTPAKLTWHLV